jgi:RecB family exonuclease
LLLLATAGERFPREATVTLLQSRHVDWKALGLERPPSADRADEWSRAAVVIEGVEEWTDLLTDWAETPDVRPDATDEQRERAAARAERNGELARGIGAAVRALDEAVKRDPATWGGHAGRLEALLDRLFPDDDDRATAELRSLIDTMADLERLAGERQPVDFDAARGWLEQAVDSHRIKLHERDGGGIRVLGAMQLRGMTFRRIHLLGMNSRVFPRTPREDAVLGDRLRRALVGETGRPLPIEAEGGSQEHLLLALVSGAASERLDVSWQRADEAGRAKVSSLALRELARMALGRPDLLQVRDDALHLPSHPKQWLEALVDETGLLAPDEARLLAALHARAVDAAAPLSERFPELKPGLDMLLATQAFHPVNAAYDARIGPRERNPTLSVSKIETLGKCPLQFFFAEVLRVRPLEEPVSVYEIESREVGNRVHDLLEEIYGRLRDEEAFDTDDEEALVARGLELLDERRDRVLGDVERLKRRLPVLWGQLSQSWLEAVRRFMKHDLERIAGKLRPVELERLRTEELDLGEGVREEVRGQFDRRFEGEEGTRVGDYKTSTFIAPRVDATAILKGRQLQVPLYSMMAGRTEVELLGIHPDLDPGDDKQRALFSWFDDDEQAQSFLHTLRVLFRLRDEGVFPFHEDSQQCGWCDFQKACRRKHPPTRDRELLLTDADDYRKLDKKTKSKPRVT